MGVGLIESSRAYAGHIAACEEALSPHVEWSLMEILREEDAEWLERLDIVQPALFAVMVSLAKLWRECGVEPAAVVGHSQGEIAAAHIAGGLSLDDAALVVSERGKAMARIAGKGGMLSVSLTPDQLTPYTEPLGERVGLAAINGPTSLVLSGDPEALTEIKGACERDGVRAKSIAVDYAAHSPQIDAFRGELLEAFAPISPRSGEIPLHSTVTGEPIDTAQMGPEYWYRNLRQAVLRSRFCAHSSRWGGGPSSRSAPTQCWASAPRRRSRTRCPIPRRWPCSRPCAAGRTRPSASPSPSPRLTPGAYGCGGRPPFRGTGARHVPLPTYPFQRERYWLSAGGVAGDASSVGLSDPDHPLLAAAIEDPEGKRLTLTGRLSLATHPWLADHKVGDTVVLSGAAFLELALHATELVGAEGVEELTLEAPLTLPENGSISMQVCVSGPDESGSREMAIHSRPATEDAEWIQNVTGILSSQPPISPEPLGSWPPEGAEPLEVDHAYDLLAERGLEYGPTFKGLSAAWRDGERIYAEVSLPEESRPKRRALRRPSRSARRLPARRRSGKGGWLRRGCRACPPYGAAWALARWGPPSCGRESPPERTTRCR